MKKKVSTLEDFVNFVDAEFDFSSFSDVFLQIHVLQIQSSTVQFNPVLVLQYDDLARKPPTQSLLGESYFTSSPHLWGGGEMTTPLKTTDLR